MPIYLYEREDGTQFETIQKFSDDPLATCPTTGQKVKKLMAPSAFHLKGGGWYKTDYSSSSSSGKSASTSTETSSNSDTCSASSSASDSGAKDTQSSAPSCSKGAACGCA